MSKDKKLFTSTYYFEGKRYFVRSAKSQRDAERRADKAKADRVSGMLHINSDMSVANYALNWVKVYKSATTSSTVFKSYVSRIKNHIIPDVGAMRMSDIKPTHLQALLNKHVGQSKSHCDKLLVTVRTIFKQAYKDGVILRDYSEDIKPPTSASGTPQSYTLGAHRCAPRGADQ